jgi:hypothetical protein
MLDGKITYRSSNVAVGSGRRDGAHTVERTAEIGSFALDFEAASPVAIAVVAAIGAGLAPGTFLSGFQ